jgi:hypothetical protein
MMTAFLSSVPYPEMLNSEPSADETSSPHKIKKNFDRRTHGVAGAEFAGIQPGVFRQLVDGATKDVQVTPLSGGF